jgi:putative heme-binding domain-containing protein
MQFRTAYSLAGLLFLVVVLLGSATYADHDDVIPHRQDRPPNDPYTAAEAQAKMTVPEGFRVELVASEPDIVNPIAMTFDDRGRIFVTESVEYPRKPAGPGRDRIKILEDRDGDGRCEHVTVFADGMNIPTGVAVGYGGVWVLNAPDLLFLREKDGKEVSREVILTGFGRADTHELPSSLTWGPDGWLYGLNGVFNPSEIVDNRGKRHRFTCAMWRYHQRTRDVQVFAEGTSNPYGLAWDAEGSAIIEACHWANDHLFHFVETGIYNRQAGAYPPFAMKIGSITDHSHQKTAYCGIVNLDTDAFPAQYREKIVVGNIHGGCLNVDRLTRDGATYLAKAEPDLLTANDVWFMPVALKIGPDASLYVLDWYDRYHCSQDAARDPAGVDRLKGRLWRLRYGQTPRAAKFDLATESDEQLVRRLSSGNIYFRETAQRLLNERLADNTRRPDAATALRIALEKLVLDDSAARKTRLHALWSLIGGDALRPSLHEKLFRHPDAAFRAWAVRAAGNQGKVSQSICENVVHLARDPSADVQLQVAIAARKIDQCDALAVLVDVVIHCGHDKLIPAIVWHNLHSLLETEGERFAAMLHTAEGNKNHASPAVATLLHRAVDRLLSAQQPDVASAVALLDHAFSRHNTRMPQAIGAVSARLNGLNDEKRADLKDLIRPLLDRILADRNSSPLHLSTQLLAARLGLGTIDTTQVRATLLARDESDDARLQALEALVAFRDRALLEHLPNVLSTSSTGFGTRVLAALGRVEDHRLADVLLAQYPRLSPELQPLAIDLVMQREPWARKLLNAVLADKLPKSILNANHLRKILDSNDREALWAVEKAFGRVREERNPERERVVAEMTEYFRENIGDPAAGQQVFKSFCAQCHTIHGEGHKLGPDITANGRASFEQLVSNVFDPSLVIGPAYQVVTVVTEDGRNLTGLIAEDNDQRIVLRLPGDAEEIVPRNNINYLRPSKLSMMPEGIESVLSRRQLADLFAFLAFDKPPDDPTAKPIPGAPQLQVSR